MPPNLLVVILDTARLDAVAPYEPRAATPAIAQLARRGVAVTQARATACWTVPSHVSILTGTMPRASGMTAPVRAAGTTRDAVRGLADRSLPEALRRSGYATAACSANAWITAASGFDTGFEEFALVGPGRQAKIQAGDARSRASWALESLRAEVDDGAREAARTLARWLDGLDRSRPFFWFVNLVECHSPYLPPQPWNDLGPLARLRAGSDARRYQTLDAIWRICLTDEAVPESSLERMRHLYDRSVAYMDAWLAELLERLDSTGILGETLVVVTSDHGENFGDGGLVSHAFSLDERLLRVPLIAAGPGASAFADRVTSLAELPRLLAGAVELAASPWSAEDLPRGAAVAQFDPPALPGDPRTSEVAESFGLDRAGIRLLTTPQTAATDGRLKLVLEPGSERVFDLEADPHERDPVRPPELGDGDRASLASLRAALEHPTVSGGFGSLPAAGPDDVTAEADPDEVAAIEERMRLLGYM